MKYIFIEIILIFVFSLHTIIGQVIEGRITDSKGKPIDNVNIFIYQYNIGTISNNDGYYRLKLPKGNFQISFSHIAYNIYNINLIISKDTVIVRDIILTEKPIILACVNISADDDFARYIIKNVLKYKKKYHSYLKEFQYIAYNKIVSYGIMGKDKIIGGILESFSHCYVKKPDQFKEIILAKRQTSNLSDANNFLAMGSFIDVFNEIIPIDEISVISPLSDKCFDYYNYFFEDSIEYNGDVIYNVKFEPKNGKLMLFRGELKVLTYNYGILQCELFGDDNIKTSIKEDITILQKFKHYRDGIWTPFLLNMKYIVNIPLIKRLTSTKILMEQVSLINNLQLGVTSGIFDNYVSRQKLLPREKQDSLWNNNQLLLLTDREKKAYKDIDRLVKKVPMVNKIIMYFSKYSPYLTKIPVTSFSDFYHKNKVEGDYFGLGFDTKDYFNKFALRLSIGRGSFNKKVGYLSNVVLKPFRNGFYTGFALFDKVFFKERYIDYSAFDITTECIFNKRDYANYYYSKGNDFIIGYKGNYSGLSISFTNRKDYSIVKTLKGFDKNLIITDGINNFIKLSFNVNSKKYIDLGFYTIEDITKDYFIIKFDYYYSSKMMLKSAWDYRTFYFDVAKLKKIASIGSFYIALSMGKNYGAYLEQNKFYIPGKFSSFSVGKNAFYGVSGNSISGNDYYYLFFEYNFYNILFAYLKMPYLRDSKYGFIVFSKIGGTNRFSLGNIRENINEVGFSINNILLFFRLNFFWTSINDSGYRFGISFTLNRDF